MMMMKIIGKKGQDTEHEHGQIVWGCGNLKACMECPIVLYLTCPHSMFCKPLYHDFLSWLLLFAELIILVLICSSFNPYTQSSPSHLGPLSSMSSHPRVPLETKTVQNPLSSQSSCTEVQTMRGHFQGLLRMGKILIHSSMHLFNHFKTIQFIPRDKTQVVSPLPQKVMSMYSQQTKGKPYTIPGVIRGQARQEKWYQVIGTGQKSTRKSGELGLHLGQSGQQ